MLVKPTSERTVNVPPYCACSPGVAVGVGLGVGVGEEVGVDVGLRLGVGVSEGVGVGVDSGFAQAPSISELINTTEKIIIKCFFTIFPPLFQGSCFVNKP